ncbi:M48 family peptidase [Verminephrobacter aporrectodeae subsp. tuberculatae]|uniref:M48 family metallopeptidase n=1 Tax=Verminephrobacter aporrectodeae TaxID=1110389 RepID=UPI002237C7B3|nr:SprT family zinc-dependent metalloprotease [Verminephrobacter aporrectodeae]MCW5222523.1 M48 family peptidase [Verminephrobacter aporrectodeae subsp. tuberculatae]MCW5287988.1 M48 family peptidase [Verminephrobacter aporrectodeae subsp. tuberculatae]MCW8163461.1 M48 family peptidase [Verminephrobacter aporrectodeae subsp. tuberculatae]MCW8167818.1 M48 family peptidase [Verminephrobacter aporrectodeae subsp. tuberculatae]
MQRFVQLALDLFDPPPGAADAGREEPPPATARPAPPPAVPLPSLLSPAEFRHPRANGELLLGDAVVAYALQRARRRSIGLIVGADGLSVRAPTWVSLGAVDAALRAKSDWILRKLTQARERQRRLEGERIVWTDGAALQYLGDPLKLVLDPGHGFSEKGGALLACAAGDGAGPCLHIGLPHGASAAQIRDAVQAWLMRAARRHFSARLDHFAPLLGVRWTSLRLSSAQTRWGSARADGSIRLNWRLLHYRPAIIDYVVAHELAHLRVMDHSPRFWDTVASVLPDYAQLRKHLRDAPAPPWD